MVRKSYLLRQALLALPLASASLLTAATAAVAGAQAIPRIAGPVENSQLVSLPGEVHPWARAQFDRGIAPANLSGHMLLVLQRSAEQESALQALLASQQDKNSPNYHKWLTPDEFGKQFGVADADVQAVSGYLASRGIAVGRVYSGHGALEVTATAEQMRSTFQTEIHKYAVAGKTFYANATAPKIPSALRSVVSGFAGLNNFHVAGGSGAGSQGTLDPSTHRIHPLYTITGGTTNTYGVAPADLSAIYDIPAATGQGNGGQNVSIGVLGDSNINVSYINNYRSIFGLTAKPPIVVVDGNDPGINDDAYIAYKQIELLSAVAPNANIYYYTSANVADYDTGMNFALVRALEDNRVQVLLNGYQSCETALGANMLLVNQVYEQAAAQGITVVAAAGNTGSAGCQVPGTAGPASTKSGFAVNGYASSPFATAVGGTDFYYGTTSTTQPSAYWTTTNTTTYGSTQTATTHIPEQAWNDSNTSQGTPVQLAGGGGPSTAGADGVSTPQPIPSYQLAYQTANPTVPKVSTTARILPDVSFFAGSGANDSMGYNNTAYVFCMKPGDCQAGGNPVQFTYSGGTEASSAVFAGAVALALNQSLASAGATSPANYSATGTAQFGLGNVNPTLYSLFGKIASYDIKIGNNELLCDGKGSNCANGTTTKPAPMDGYKTGAGYDAVTGLGSFDVTSFVSKYAPANTAGSTVTLSVLDATTGLPPVCVSGGVTTANCTIHSTYIKFVVTVTGSSGTPTQDVAIMTTSPLASLQGATVATLNNGIATVPNYNTLPGGTYQIYARYAGDGNYAPAVSSPYTITVKPEACAMVIYDHNINAAISNLPYGTPVNITAEPYSTAYGYAVGTPTGALNVLDSYNSGAARSITTLPLNSEGAASFVSNLLAYGTHSIVLAYPGDASYSSCQTYAFNVNVTQAGTVTTLNAPENDTGGGGSTATLGVTAVVESSAVASNQPSNGTSPTGTVKFSDLAGQVATLVPGFDPNGNAIATASITVGQNDIPANGQITATYIPASTEINYTGSTSAPKTFNSTTALINNATTTTFTITDTASGGPVNYPAQDSITLHISVSAANPDSTRFLVYANGVQLTTPITKNGQGLVTGGGIKPDPNGNATYVLPQLNGYLALPSGQVQLTVIYDGWISGDGLIESDPSSANQTINIIDDRTSADFSLQSDTTINQQQPLTSTTTPATTQAAYNLRLTSIYNFQSAYSNTAINLSCSVVGYLSSTGVHSTPSGLACGFNSALSATTASVTFAGNSTSSGFIPQTLYVGAAGGYSIANNTAPAQPASRWWVAAGGTTLACIFLLGVPSRRRNWQSLLGACIVAVFGFSMTGCGVTVASGPEQQYYKQLNSGTSGSSGSSGSGGNGASGPTVPAGIYTVLVTATTTTNTTLVHTLPVEVQVGVMPPQ